MIDGASMTSPEWAHRGEKKEEEEEEEQRRGRNEGGEKERQTHDRMLWGERFKIIQRAWQEVISS